MTIDLTACEPFEIAALRRAHGALDARAAADLDAHVASCDSCRRFCAIAAATETALEQTFAAAAAAPDRTPSRVREVFRRHWAADRARTLAGVAAAVVTVALMGWSHGAVVAGVVGALAAVMVAIGLQRVVLPRQRLARAAASVDADLLEFLRDDLDRGISRLRRTRPWLLPLGVLSVLLLLLTILNIVKDLWLVPEPIEPAGYLVPLVQMALLCLMSWWDDRYTLPQLEREREELA